jgi:hypothetical protein
MQEDASKQLIDWVTSTDDFSFIDLNLNPRPLVQPRLQQTVSSSLNLDLLVLMSM